jgi:hypothetical protein
MAEHSGIDEDTGLVRLTDPEIEDIQRSYLKFRIDLKQDPRIYSSNSAKRQSQKLVLRSRHQSVKMYHVTSENKIRTSQFRISSETIAIVANLKWDPRIY